MNNDLKDEIDIFINAIKKSDIYKEYLSILDKVNKSDEIKKIINEMRSIQKQLVKTPSIKLEEELNNIPLYLDYKEKYEEINDIFLIVQDKFNSFIDELIIN